MSHHNKQNFSKISKFFWVPLFLISYNFLANLSNDLYLPTFPSLVHALNTSSTYVQLTLTAWFAGVVAPQLIFGPLSDHIGRRPLLFWGGVCFAVASLMCALSLNIWMLLSARFLQGIGVCSLNIASYSIISELYEYDYRVHLLNYISICGILAPLLGPIIGGYIFIYYGWQMIFFLIFFTAIICLLGLWFKLPESNTQIKQSSLSIESIYKSYSSLIKNHYYMKTLISYSLLLGGLIAYLTAAPFIIINLFHIAPENFGFNQVLIFFGYISGALCVLFLIKSHGHAFLIRIGLLFIGLACFLLILTGIFWSQNLWFFLISMAIYMLGLGICTSPMTNEVISLDHKNKGSTAAFLGFGMATSCMFSSLLVGLFYNDTLLSITSIIFVIGLLATSVFYTYSKFTNK